MARHATNAAPDISVVVPVHNESDNIAPLLVEIDAVLEGRTEYEVIVVNDGSSDATPQILSDCVTRHPRLRPLRHERNSGQTAALATGVRAARSPWIVTLDGDGQNDPADIPKLLAHRQKAGRARAPAMIAGWRVKRRDTWLKRVSSRIANGVRARILNDHTPDVGCGLKLFKRDVFLKLPQFDHMHRFLPALFQRAGEKVVSVPVSHRPRASGRSHYGLNNRLWVGIADMFGVLWLGKRMSLASFVHVAGNEGANPDDGGARPDGKPLPPGGDTGA
jgi:dolichol-phosphate mannosyltransferase